MKKILLSALLLTAVIAGFAQSKNKPATSKAKNPATAKDTLKPKAASPDKYHDNVDDRMKGPNGEKIYIGPNGGRYYEKNGRKVYVEYKGSKKKAAGKSAP